MNQALFKIEQFQQTDLIRERKSNGAAYLFRKLDVNGDSVLFCSDVEAANWTILRSPRMQDDRDCHLELDLAMLSVE